MNMFLSYASDDDLKWRRMTDCGHYMLFDAGVDDPTMSLAFNATNAQLRALSNDDDVEMRVNFDGPDLLLGYRIKGVVDWLQRRAAARGWSVETMTAWLLKDKTYSRRRRRR